MAFLTSTGRITGMAGAAVLAMQCGDARSAPVETRAGDAQFVAGVAPESAMPPANPGRPRFDINAYDVAGNTLLDQLAIEKAIYPHLGPAHSEDDVEKARTALEETYRSKGYESVVVEIPQQNASNGIVRLQVTEATLGEVRVSGARFYSPKVIRGQVASLVEGQVPNLSQAQTELAEVNRFPDRQVAPLLKPGKVPGTIDVELKVTDALPFHATVQIGNDHSANTEPLRLLGTVRYNNLWQAGHAISGTYVVSPQNRENTEVFAGSYLAPVWNTPWSLLLYGYKSNSNIASLGGTNVLGDGYSIGLRGILSLPSHGNWSHSVNFGIDYKSFKEDIRLGNATIRSPIRYWPLTATYSTARVTDISALNASLGVTAGLRGLGSGENDFENKRAFASGNFLHLNLDADYTRQFGGDIVGTFRVSGQLADGPLVSNEQFAAGGFTSVRGYLQSAAVGDDGVVGSVELRTSSLGPQLAEFVDDWRFFVFSDVGRVWLRRPLAEQRSEFSLLSVGMGTRLQLFRYLYGDFALGFPLTNAGGKGPVASFSVKAEY